MANENNLITTPSIKGVRYVVPAHGGPKTTPASRITQYAVDARPLRPLSSVRFAYPSALDRS